MSRSRTYTRVLLVTAITLHTFKPVRVGYALLLSTFAVTAPLCLTVCIAARPWDISGSRRIIPTLRRAGPPSEPSRRTFRRSVRTYGEPPVRRKLSDSLSNRRVFPAGPMYMRRWCSVGNEKVCERLTRSGIMPVDPGISRVNYFRGTPGGGCCGPRPLDCVGRTWVISRRVGPYM